MRMPEDDYASEIIKDVNPSEIDIPAEEIHFHMQKPNDGRYYCVCLVDMVGSTQITAQLVIQTKLESIIQYSLMQWLQYQRTLEQQ